MNDDKKPVKEFAKHEGVSIRTVYYWIGNGIDGVRLKPTYRGGRVFIRKQDFDSFNEAIAKQRVPPMPPKKTDPKALEILKRRGYLK